MKPMWSGIIDVWLFICLLFLGLDYGAMGEKFLYQFNSWCSERKFLGCHVQRFHHYTLL